MKAVYSCESGYRGIWWYPAVKSIMPKTLGLRVPIRLIICWIFGMGHPSSPPVAEFNRTKSRVKRHFWGRPLGAGLSTWWTWLHSVAYDSLMTPNSKSASTCFRISFCFSSYMGVVTYLHLSQSSLVQLMQAPDGPLWRMHLWILEPMPWVWPEVVWILRRWSNTSTDLESPPNHQLSPHRQGYISN